MKQPREGSQKHTVLAHMKKHKSISSWEARENYGITRLADRIFQLKDMGFKIQKHTMIHKNKSWAVYYL